MIPLWHAEDVLRTVRGQCLHEQSWQAHGVAVDSAAVRQGDVFIALGDPAHDAVSEAFRQGAAAAIVQRAPSQVPPDAPLIYVDDTAVALQDLARTARERCQGQIIAVVNGAESPEHAAELGFLLQSGKPLHIGREALAQPWATALALARIPAETAYAIIPVARPGLAEALKAHIALVTDDATPPEQLVECFRGLTPDSTILLNREHQHVARLHAVARAKGLKKVQSYGLNNKADARLLEVESRGGSSLVHATLGDFKISYTLPTLERHKVLDSLGLLLAAITAGANLIACLEALDQPEAEQAARA